MRSISPNCGSFVAAVLIAIAWSRSVADDRPLIEFPIDEPRSVVSVPVTTPEGTFDFILDTGASVSVYSSTMKWPDKPVKIEVPRTLGKDREVPFYRRPTSTIGGIELLRDDLIAVIDFKELSNARGRPIDGLLGMDVLSQFVVQLDFDANAVRLFAKVPSDCGTQIPFKTSRSKQPRIPVELGKSQFEVVVDTGSTRELQVSPTRWRELQEQGRVSRTRVINLATANGIVFSNQAFVNGFSIGGHSFDNVQVGIAQIETLGNGFLSRYLVTFDFPGKALYLKPGRNFATPLPRDASGLGLLMKDHHFEVVVVSENSPAALVGIRKGDTLTKINRRNARTWKLLELRNALSKPGETVELTVKRADQFIEFSIELVDY